jgi:hypothetical protein
MYVASDIHTHEFFQKNIIQHTCMYVKLHVYIHVHTSYCTHQVHYYTTLQHYNTTIYKIVPTVNHTIIRGTREVGESVQP